MQGVTMHRLSGAWCWSGCAGARVSTPQASRSFLIKMSTRRSINDIERSSFPFAGIRLSPTPIGLRLGRGIAE